MSAAVRGLMGLAMAAAMLAAGAGLIHFGVYGLTMFVAAPVLLGAIAVWVIRPATGTAAAGWGALANVAGGVAVLAFKLDGLICVLMALPLALPLGALGGWMLYRAALAPRGTASVAALLILLPPATLTWDARARPELFEVRTAVEIAAPPERVWARVIAFPELAAPRDWLFRAGIAYPIRARIEGSGAGAVRYCEFSTGPFVEPIEVWREAELLRFRVTENPAPMREWSPFAEALPKHLHGYMVSERGQFRLTKLAGNRTLLEGTTWYRHGLWPAAYWRWWSDAIIHRIHLRVLEHIRTLAENGGT